MNYGGTGCLMNIANKALRLVIPFAHIHRHDAATNTAVATAAEASDTTTACPHAAISRSDTSGEVIRRCGTGFSNKSTTARIIRTACAE